MQIKVEQVSTLDPLPHHTNPLFVSNTILNFGLIVVNMQNGFVSKGGSYDRL